MQDAGFGETARGRDAIFYSGDRPATAPHIIHNESWAAAQFILRRELNEFGHAIKVDLRISN